MDCAASATAFNPDPQTLLMVIALTSRRQPALESGLPRGILTEAGGDYVAHDAFIDRRSVDAGAPHRLPDDESDPTELRIDRRGRLEISQWAFERRRR